MSELHGCQLCPRLSSYRSQQKRKYPNYHCLPVAGFGAENARLLIVGLAPGLHGANATGRPFSGDASGDLLFACLHKFGFATRSTSRLPDDSMQLKNCRITNAVKCVPPGNKPVADEINTCNQFLQQEISGMGSGCVLLALGTIAHRAVLKAMDLSQSQFRFHRFAEHDLPGGLKLIDSYHPSLYNQNTGKITPEILENVFDRVSKVLR